MRGKIVLIFLFLLCPLWHSAQEYSPLVRDNQFWTSLSLDAKLHKRWKGYAELALRTHKNMQVLNTAFVEFGLRYNKKDWSVKGNFRSSERFDRHENRWFIDTEYQFISSKRFDMEARVRTQYSYFSDDRPGEWRVRQKLKAKYNIKKNPLNPTMDAETFLSNSPTGWFLSVFRWSVGVEFDIISDLELSLLYRIEREFFVAEPDFNQIAIVSFSYSLGKIYKKGDD